MNLNSHFAWKEVNSVRLNIDKDTKVFLNVKNHNTVTVSADRECVGANCEEYIYPVVHYRPPDEKEFQKFDRFDVDGVTVWFDRKLETVPEVTLKLEHHVLRDKIRVDGLPTPPEVTHIHL